jgi:hypothetical protein
VKLSGHGQFCGDRADAKQGIWRDTPRRRGARLTFGGLAFYQPLDKTTPIQDNYWCQIAIAGAASQAAGSVYCARGKCIASAIDAP